MEPCPKCGKEMTEWSWKCINTDPSRPCIYCDDCNVIAPAPLRSVDDYNREKQEARKKRAEAAKRSGVACPKCGGELLWSDPYGIAYAVPWPETRDASCAPCGLCVQLEM